MSHYSNNPRQSRASPIRRWALILSATVAALTLAACDGESDSNTAKDAKAVQKVEKARGRAYIPSSNVEFNNYNEAQKLYDSPGTIIWCTTTWGNANSPLVTVPIAGKLTSSSVSYFSQDKVINNDESGSGVRVDAKSVDGMYHGSPPAYRFGFTPGGQYVDFSGMQVFCTTALTKFQRQKTALSLSIDTAGQNATKSAEKILRDGTGRDGKITPAAKKQAQSALEEAGLDG